MKLFQKTNELARYLNGRAARLDFSEPAPVLERTDNRAIREAIINLTQSEARKLGIGKSTLHGTSSPPTANGSAT